MSERDRWIEFGASDEAIVAAVAEQRRFVMHMLGARRWEAEDVMSQLALDMVASMPRWVAVPQRPRPVLGAWARGVAVRTFYAWVRSPGAGRGPGGTSLVSTEALAERGVAILEPTGGRSSLEPCVQVRGALVNRLRQLAMLQPGGAAAWDAMVTAEGRVRGKDALAKLRLLLEVADPGGNLRRTAGFGTSIQSGDAGAANAA